MMLALTRNAVLVWSIATLCAALMGCSSSGDGDSGDLERQLDMAQAALAAAEDAQMTAEEARDAALAAQTTAEGERDAAQNAQTTAEGERDAAQTAQMTAEGERDAALAAQTTAEGERDAALDAQIMAEQAAIDTRVNLAAADKIRDAASIGVETQNRVGDTIIISKRDGWESFDNVIGWRTQSQTPNAGTNYTAVSQSYRDGSLAWFLPWYDEDGNLQMNIGTALAYRPLQTDPNVWTWRVIYTPGLDAEGQTTSIASIDNHGLGAAWQGSVASKIYEGSGTLTFRAFTDLAESDSPGNPSSNLPVFAATYPDVALDPPIPAIIAEGRDGHWLNAGDGLRGSLDGVPGTFSCAAGDRYYCGLETSRGHVGRGYTADVGGDPVIFTPDDGSQPTTLPHPTPTEVATANYLSFGSWLFVPEDITDLDNYDFGVFSSGDDPFMVDNLQGLAGTAAYAGEASGTYADVPEASISPFSAKVELTADFGTDQDFGRIEGRVYEFEIDGGATTSLTELGLYTAPWRGEGTTNIFPSRWEGASPFPGGWVDGQTYRATGRATWQGVWSAKFFGNGSAAGDLPSAFAGTFGATDGDHTFAGSFGARRQ